MFVKFPGNYQKSFIFKEKHIEQTVLCDGFLYENVGAMDVNIVAILAGII